MNDYRKIRVSPKFSKLRSIDVAAIHRESLNWLAGILQQHAGKTNIVVTHHAPSAVSLPAYRVGDVVSAAYVSNLDPFVEAHQPLVWIHGHLHNSSDYKVGDTRVMCNPKGYPFEENPDFDPACYVDI